MKNFIILFSFLMLMSCDNYSQKLNIKQTSKTLFSAFSNQDPELLKKVFKGDDEFTISLGRQFISRMKSTFKNKGLKGWGAIQVAGYTVEKSGEKYFYDIIGIDSNGTYFYFRGIVGWSINGKEIYELTNDNLKILGNDKNLVYEKLTENTDDIDLNWF